MKNRYHLPRTVKNRYKVHGYMGIVHRYDLLSSQDPKASVWNKTGFVPRRKNRIGG